MKVRDIQVRAWIEGQHPYQWAPTSYKYSETTPLIVVITPVTHL